MKGIPEKPACSRLDFYLIYHTTSSSGGAPFLGESWLNSDFDYRGPWLVSSRIQFRYAWLPKTIGREHMTCYIENSDVLTFLLVIIYNVPEG
jgi:hypothetical protein